MVPERLDETGGLKCPWGQLQVLQVPEKTDCNLMEYLRVFGNTCVQARIQATMIVVQDYLWLFKNTSVPKTQT